MTLQSGRQTAARSVGDLLVGDSTEVQGRRDRGRARQAAHREELGAVCDAVVQAALDDTNFLSELAERAGDLGDGCNDAVSRPELLASCCLAAAG